MQALAAAEQAEAAVQAIAYLSDKRLEASASVTAQTEEQLSAIKQAAQQALINEPQALVLWTRARRDRESQLKRAILSNSACSTERVETHDFEACSPLPPFFPTRVHALATGVAPARPLWYL